MNCPLCFVFFFLNYDFLLEPDTSHVKTQTDHIKTTKPTSDDAKYRNTLFIYKLGL